MQDLERVIRKALNNGWKIPFEEPILNIKISREPVGKVPQVTPYVLFELDGPTDWAAGIPHIIFDHYFAKALWHNPPYGLEPIIDDDWLEPWKKHLQAMVIADDPVKYLEGHA